MLHPSVHLLQFLRKDYNVLGWHYDVECHFSVFYRKCSTSVICFIYMKHAAVGIEFCRVGSICKDITVCRCCCSDIPKRINGCFCMGCINLLVASIPPSPAIWQLTLSKLPLATNWLFQGIIIIASHIVVGVISGYDH